MPDEGAEMSGAADGVSYIVYKKPCGTRLVCTYTARDFSGDGIKHIARTVFCVLLLCIEGEQAHAPGIELFNVGDFVAVIVGIADQRSAVI